MSTPPRVHTLPQSVINAIAAGEVVERPAVVVKELVENALDAGATRIEVVLHDGGQRQIQVTDNGHGIIAEDLPIAVKRYTTSKITSLADLASLHTLGFRGEALASIGSVGHLSVASRTANSSQGVCVLVTEGSLHEPKPVGMPPGTSVTVTNLFANVPARRKFLKTPRTELAVILQHVTAAATTHPNVSFTVTHQDKSVLQLPAQHQQERLALLYPGEVDHLLPIECTSATPAFVLRGFLGKPQLARRRQTHHALFINQRPVRFSSLHQAIIDGYGTLIPPRLEPWYLLWLELPPGQLDANVHPRKEVIELSTPTDIITAVQTHLLQTLQKMDLTYQPSPKVGWSLHDSGVRKATIETSTILKQLVEPWQTGHGVRHAAVQRTQAPAPPTIMQLLNTYLITNNAEGLVLLDQHAAHERILYEQYRQTYQERAATTTRVQLLPAAILTLGPTDVQTLTSHLQELSELGFHLEPFGQQQFKVTHAPAHLPHKHITQVLTDVLHDLATDIPVSTITTNLSNTAHRTIAYLACRSAIKAGDYLTPQERQDLITKLAETPNQFTCPHGRPTTVQLNKSDLEKMFRRKK